MSLRSAHQMASIAIACVAVTTLVTPVRAQMIVYDPSNYAQNVLQAARALQQINNQITSLQNQTQMLLNQAKNLTSLPYSNVQAIEQSFARTQQLLNEAQHLAYDVNQIDQAFQRLYPQGYTGATSSQQLVSDAKERWQNSLAAYQDALRVQVGAVGNLDTTRTETDTLVSSSQSACRHFKLATNWSHCRPDSSPISLQSLRHNHGRKASPALAPPPIRSKHASSSAASSVVGKAISLRPCRCSTDRRTSHGAKDHRTGRGCHPARRRCARMRSRIGPAESHLRIFATSDGRQDGSACP